MKLLKLLVLAALLALPFNALGQVNLKIDLTSGIILAPDGTSLTLATEDTDNIILVLDNTSKWTIEGADGDIVPTTDSNVDLGSATKMLDNIYVDDLTVSAAIGATGAITATGGFVTGGNIVSDTDGNDSVGTAAVNFGDAYFGDGTDYVHIDEDELTSTESIVIGTGNGAGEDATIALNGASSDLFVLQDDGSTVNFQITQAGVWSSAAGLDLGLEYVTGANTACTTTCGAADGGALFGVDLAAGASAPVIVEADDGTADACLCLEVTS